MVCSYAAGSNANYLADAGSAQAARLSLYLSFVVQARSNAL
ncbi:MAG: hypothetical protein JWR25_1959 [Noviherbaspirillum sp.]|nr:hypothetical protein [Noviherbaspirillum sp.]